MVFNPRQLDNLDYDDVEPLLEGYIHEALEDFANSKIGKAHIQHNPEGGNWIGTFIEFAYLYGGYTLPKMTKANVQEVMEYTLPRKLTLLNPSDTDGAIDELVAFWTFLDAGHGLRSAKAIAKYLSSIETKFPQWMFDPNRGGIAKSFVTQGMAAGFDMTTQAGVDAFREEYNRNLAVPPPPPQGPMLPVEPFAMTTAPPDMQRAFEQLGIELPPVGQSVNLMGLMEQLLTGLEGLDPKAAEKFVAELEDDVDALAPPSRGGMADLRTSLLQSKPSEEIALSAADRAVLERQTITETGPGTILPDFQAALDLIGDRGLPVSGTLQHLSLKVLEEFNQRLSKPIHVDLKRPQQKSYPNIHGLYLLLRATGITEVVAQGKQSRLVLNPAIYDSWQQLNPTEKYFSLLEIWFIRSHPEMLGEERSGPFMVGDRCLQSWPHLAKTATVTVADYNAQKQFAYYPGLESIALMEMFGLIAITPGQPDLGKGWRFRAVKAEPWGKALITLLHNAYRAVDYEWPGTVDPAQPLGDLQPVLQPYFPAWQQCLLVPSTEFRPGRHIFKVSLGKVWRRIAIAGEATLDVLSSLILDSVEFGHDHLDQFTVKTPTGRVMQIAHPFAEGDLSTDEVKVGNLPLQVGSTMDYLFDFGDCWEFQLVLETIEPALEADPAKGLQKTKQTKTAKRKKPKVLGEILEVHGEAPEQYPEGDW